MDDYSIPHFLNCASGCRNLLIFNTFPLSSPKSSGCHKALSITNEEMEAQKYQSFVVGSF